MTPAPRQVLLWVLLRILIADDYPDATESLCKLLKLWGHECAVAYDGPAALRLAMDGRPDVALLDIGMPKMDGYTVGRQILERHPGLPVFAITGYGTAADVQQAKEAGFTGHLLKPVDPAILQAVLATIRPLQ